MIIRNQLTVFSLFICLLAAFTQTPATAQISPLKVRTVVIDPGHGGKDPGCVRNGIYEKDIVLSVGLKLGKMIQDSLSDVKVIYTRSSDQFVELQERADIANRNDADLFISIHINATKSSSPQGSETFCMGLNMSEDNMEVCQMENSVITLEDNYSSKYEGFDPNSPESYIIFSLLQNSHLEQSLKLAEGIQKMSEIGPLKHSRGVRQAGFVVLWRCTAPAVLTELGFLTNDSDFKILSDKRNHSALAGNIFKAIKMYKNDYEFSSSKPDDKEITVVDSEVVFAIQIFASVKVLESGSPEFKGLDCYRVKKDNFNKYVTGRFSTLDEAKNNLDKVKALFPDAFIISL